MSSRCGDRTLHSREAPAQPVIPSAMTLIFRLVVILNGLLLRPVYTEDGINTRFLERTRQGTEFSPGLRNLSNHLRDNACSAVDLRRRFGNPIILHDDSHVG